MMDDLDLLMKWYKSNCDGNWEHGSAVRIATIDNPGWMLEINVAGTPVEGRSLALVRIARSDENWVHYEVRNNVFSGYGGPMMLGEMIRAFIEFCDVA